LQWLRGMFLESSSAKALKLLLSGHGRAFETYENFMAGRRR